MNKNKREILKCHLTRTELNLIRISGHSSLKTTANRIPNSARNKSLLGEVWDFLKVRKAWWLAPIVIMLVLVGILIIFGQSSVLSPFIYTLF